MFFSTIQSNSPLLSHPKKQTKCLLTILRRCAFAASADVPQKDVIVEADSFVTKNTGNVALLVEGLIQAGSGTVKGSGSTSRGHPGLRGYDFAREEESSCVAIYESCVSNSQCCNIDEGFCCVASSNVLPAVHVCALPYNENGVYITCM